jgi:glycerol kinase
MIRPTQAIAVIDQGSTATKAAVATADGELLFTTELAVERRSEAERVEHDPLDLVRSVRAVLDRCRDGRRLHGVALTCQRSTCLLWNRADGQPLTPAISWQDRRESERVEALRTQEAEISRKTGLRLSPHYAAPKLAGMLEASPELRRRAADGEVVGGTLDAFLLQRLAGQPITDPTHAGRTLLYNLQRDNWDASLCRLWNLPPAMLPELRPSRSPRGYVDGLPLLASVGDQQAALLGHGGWHEGVTAIHFGTGAFVLSGTGTIERRHPGLLTAVLASTPTDKRLQLEGTINSAGSAVDVVCAHTGQELTSWTTRSLDELSPPLMLPSLAGIGAPWWRPELNELLPRGVLDQAEPLALLAGVLNGLAHRVTDITEAMGHAGVELAVLRASGKLTRLSGLMQRIADLTRIPVEVSSEEETGLAGLARLAGDALDQPPAAAAARYESRWPPNRTATERHRWREFVEGILAEEA